MVDQSTNRRSIRQSSQKPPPSRSQSSQSLPHSQHSTRVTRSRSRDFSDAEVRELVPRVKRRKAAYEEENVVNSSAQVNRVGKKGARSKDPQGLPAVTEELGVVDAQSLLNEVGKVDSRGDEGRGGHGRILRKHKSPGASSTISGTTSRNSYSAQDLPHLNSRKAQQIRGTKEAAAGPSADTSVIDLPAAELKSLAPKSANSRNSNTSFHTPKNLKPAARRLLERKSGSVTAKALQVQKAQNEVDNSRTAESTAVVETTLLNVASPGKSRDLGIQDFEPSRSQSALGRHHKGDDTLRFQEFAEGGGEASAVSEKASASNPVARAQQVVEFQASRNAENSRESTFRHIDQPNDRVKKSFIDPQPNAERVSFESQDQPDGDLPAEEAEELGTEEGFQQDQRQITRQTRHDKTSSGKRSAPAPLVRRHSPKKVRVASLDESFSDEDGSEAPQEQAPAPSQFENYKTANKVAKFKKASQIKRPQIRKAWTNEETKALIELIEEYGTSWAFLKERDKKQKLGSRDQGALKDKARNMKFDFLKAGNFMPQNFEDIPLNRSQTDRLRDMGIDYQVTTAREDED